MADNSESKVALVTGSSSGIGMGTVRLLSQHGYKVAVCGSNEKRVGRVSEECAKLSPNGFKALSLVLDFSVAENGELAVKKTVEHFGRLDVLVNNAGVYLRSDANDPSTYDTYRQLLTINTDATVRASLASVEHLKKTHGSMIFVSSVASAKPIERGYAYCMSKASMTAFAKCLAVDLAPEIRVNIVSPGLVKTAIFDRIGLPQDLLDTFILNTTLQKRAGTIEEVAETIYFLVSDKAQFIHGHELFIDGGYLITPSTVSASKLMATAEGGTE